MCRFYSYSTLSFTDEGLDLLKNMSLEYLMKSSTKNFIPLAVFVLQQYFNDGFNFWHSGDSLWAERFENLLCKWL